MSALEREWIEVFRAGEYGEKGRWTLADLDKLADAYNPELHAAPVVIGHPEHDAPAWGWVKRLRRAGASLWAQLTKVAPEFEELLRQGRFLQRSVSLYKHLPVAGGPYLRHLGFLGAQPPAVKGLKPILQFTEAGAGVVDFADTPPAMRPTQAVACARYTLSPGMRVCGLELADDATLICGVEKVDYGEALRRSRARWPEDASY